jgi:CBS domain-containing protein
MHTAQVKRLPVVDREGRLLGIISRSDLLKVFNRPDQAIRREILDEVIVGEFMLDPDRFFIQVHQGVAVLEGRVEQRSLLPWLVRAVRGVEGVVRVEDRLAYDIDDIDVGGLMASPWMRL